MTGLLLDGASWFLILVGGAFALIGGIGVIRLPDFFTRLHGAGITDTMGAGFILLGLALQSGLSLVTVKLALILGFFLLTTPTAVHALAKAARHGGHRPRGLEEPGE